MYKWVAGCYDNNNTNSIFEHYINEFIPLLCLIAYKMDDNVRAIFKSNVD